MNSFDIRDILRDAGTKSKDLVPLLLRVQERFGYVPPDLLPAIARHVRLSESEAFGLLTFYRAFSLEAKGRHRLAVCTGTSCHVRGGAAVAEALSDLLGIGPGETSADGEFSLETVGCLGCCAIGPFVVLDGVFHPRVSPEEVVALVGQARIKENGK